MATAGEGRRVTEPCECGKGIVMRNERGETCCSATLQRYEALYGMPPLTGGAWQPVTPEKPHDAIPR